MGWSRDSWSTCKILEISNQEGSLRVQKVKRRTTCRRPWLCSPSETALLSCCNRSCASVFVEHAYLGIKKTLRPLCTTVAQITRGTNFKFKISSRFSNIIKHDMKMSTLIAIVSDYVEEGFFFPPEYLSLHPEQYGRLTPSLAVSLSNSLFPLTP